MVSVRIFICATVALMISTTAFAADMAAPPVAYQPVVIEQGAWYLRGDIGVSMLSEADFIYEPNPGHPPVDLLTGHAGLGDATFFDFGVGYEWNNWLRFDVTAEYRTRAPFNAFLFYAAATNAGDSYNGFLQSDIFLANAYIDLGTWNCLTPFIGVGVGGAYNTFKDLTDTGIDTNGVGIGTNASKFNFAWALHAGLAYAVTKNFSVELSYRYLNYGSVTDTINCFGGCAPDSYKLANLTSNDFMFGMRWRFPIESVPLAVAPPPPPPPPPQYPLSTRG
jgi:opacity protein-like surface antigen